MRRFLGAREPEGIDASLGGASELRGHVRLFNSLSVGAYAGWDWSPASPSLRHVFAMGARVRWIPLPSNSSLSWWLFGGIGYALAYSPGFETTLPAMVNGSPKLTTVTVDSATGALTEVPFGVGIGTVPRRGLFQFHAELVARIGFAHRGKLYDLQAGRDATAVGSKMPIAVSNPGNDAFALGLLVGASWWD